MQTKSYTDFHRFFDFSRNYNICFSSDYGGENNESKYNVYTFTFHSYGSLERWLNELNELRRVKGYVQPAEYKKIKPSTREGKLEDWLKTSEQFFKGIIVSFAIDKSFDSLFAPTAEELHKAVLAEPSFADCNLSPKILEKAYRICHFSSLILAQILGDGYRYFWMTDKDSIAQGTDRWEFTRRIHSNALNQYCEHLTDVKKGYSVPFKDGEEPPFFSEDFLSLSDLVSGSIDDFANHFTGKTAAELQTALKPKSPEILSYLKKLPTFIYILDIDGTISKCRRVEIHNID
jgi:hypothetical protein